MKRFLCFSLIAQMVLAPFAFAQDQQANDRDLISNFRASVERQFTASENSGWRYFDSEKREVRAVTLLGDMLRPGQESAEFYAITPELSDVGARAGIRVRVQKSDGKILSYRLEVSDRNFNRVLSARRISIDADLSKEENRLRLERAINSMVDEVKEQKELLGASSSRVETLFGKVMSSVLPSAHAEDPVYRSALASELRTVAGGAVLITILGLIFWEPDSEKGRKAKFISAGIGFAIAVICYVAGGAIEANIAAVVGNHF